MTVGPFRINRSVSASRRNRGDLGGREGASEGEGKTDDFLTRVSKLIPAEVVGIYLTGRQVAVDHSAVGQWAAICLALTILFRVLGTSQNVRESFKTAQWDAVIYCAISYVIWIYAMGDQLANLGLGEKQFWASLLAIAWPALAARLVLIPTSNEPKK
jgi:hypothetical protein